MNNRFEMNEATLLAYLDGRGFKYTRSGKEIFLEECPYCKSREKKFSFNADTTEFHCFKAKCEKKGNLLSFMRDQGEDPLPKKKAFILPDQVKMRSRIPIDTPEKKEASNFYDWFYKQTGISSDVLKKYDIGFLHSKGNTYITYPYLEPQGGEIFNVKHRNYKEKRDMFTVSGAKINFFGLQFVDFNKDELIITEGEKDCMAMVDYGFENVVSVPSGARGFTEAMMETLRKGKFKKLFLFFDSDDAGQQGAAYFAAKVGNWRCRYVRLPFKDAQECLRNYVDYEAIRELMDSAKKFDIEDAIENDVLYSPEEQRERFEADCRLNQYGIKFGFQLIDQVTGGLFPGQLLGILGGPGGYKTTLAQNLLHRAAADLRSDEFAAFFSMDMTAVREFQRRLQIKSGYTRSLIRRHVKEGDPNYTKLADEYCRQNGNIFTSERSNLTVPQMVQIIRNTEYMTGKRCRLVAIDYLDYIEHEDKKAFNPIGNIMNALNKKMAKPLGVSVIILVQSNRPNIATGDESFGGLAIGDGKGGRPIEQELDFYFGLYKDKKTGEQRGNFLKHREFEPDRLLMPEIYPFPYFKLEMKKLEVVDIKLISKSQLVAEAAERNKKRTPSETATTW